MKFPSPTDPAGAPFWEYYVFGQACQASLRLLPASTSAAGVGIDGSRVELFFVLSSTITDQDRADIADIADEMSDLVGDDVAVRTTTTVDDDFRLTPSGRDYWWFFAARARSSEEQER